MKILEQCKNFTQLIVTFTSNDNLNIPDVEQIAQESEISIIREVYRPFLNFPYRELNIGKKMIVGKKGPNSKKIVVEKNFPNSVIIVGEYDEENMRFEGLVKIEDTENGLECLVNIKNLKRNGHGVFKFTNGDLYVGNFLDDQMMGKGAYYFSDTGAVVSGDVFNGDIVCGRGEFSWQTENKEAHFQGDILDGVPHGEGEKNNLFILFREMYLEGCG